MRTWDFLAPRPAVRLPYFSASFKPCSQLFSNGYIILSGQLLADFVDRVDFADPSTLTCSVYYFMQANEK